MSTPRHRDRTDLEAMLDWLTGRSDAPRGASRTVTTSFGSFSLAGFLSGSFVARPAGHFLDCSRALSAAKFDCSTPVANLSAVALLLLLGTMAPCMEAACTAVMKNASIAAAGLTAYLHMRATKHCIGRQTPRHKPLWAVLAVRAASQPMQHRFWLAAALMAWRQLFSQPAAAALSARPVYGWSLHLP